MGWQLVPQHPPSLLLIPSALVPAGRSTRHNHPASRRRGWPRRPACRAGSARAAERVTGLLGWCVRVAERLLQVSRAGSSRVPGQRGVRWMCWN